MHNKKHKKLNSKFQIYNSYPIKTTQSKTFKNIKTQQK